MLRGNSKQMSIRCNFSHQAFTLLGRSSFTFAALLIILNSNSLWFTYNAANFGVWAILLSIVITHYFLLALESEGACRLLSFFYKGKPAVIYRNWLTIQENTIAFGLYHLLWSAIDNVSISPLGNLIFKSRALSGPVATNKKAGPALTVLKIPFAAIDLSEQQKFIALLKEKAPQARLSKSLNAIVDKRSLQSTKYIHIFTVIIFLAVLIDVGQATFSFVELAKRYYLSQKLAMDGYLPAAQQQYNSAEYLRTHPLPFSIISPKLLNNNSTAAGLQESRSKSLWYLDKKDEAIATQAEAAKLAPQSFKINLRLARLYATLGKTDQAQSTVDNFINKHKDALLPRLYTATIFLKSNQKEKAISSLQEYLSSLHKDYFSPSPVWPPAGEEGLHELFYEQDLQFLLPSNNQTNKKPYTQIQ